MRQYCEMAVARYTYKKLNSLHWRAGKWILPDPSLSTEQKMSALGILNLPQQLAYNKGLFMHNILRLSAPLELPASKYKIMYFSSLFQKRNLHKYMSENNVSSNLNGFVWITLCLKKLSVVYMYAHESISVNSDVSAHL